MNAPQMPVPITADNDDNASTLPSEVMSFGTFKPVGHVLIGIAGQGTTAALERALFRAGFESGLVWITPRESADELQALIEDASPLAGFGYEITLMRRYVELSKSGHRWLLVKIDSDEQAAAVGEAAREAGATVAVRYGRLIVEELI
jgi:hypothetical protein